MKSNFKPKESISSIRTIYFALIAGMGSFFIMVIFLRDWKLPNQFLISDPLVLSGIFLTMAGIPLSTYFSNRILNKSNIEDSIEEKIVAFRSGMIIRIAFFAGIGNYASVIVLITDNAIGIILFILAILGIINFPPTSERIANKVKLNPSELELLK